MKKLTSLETGTGGRVLRMAIVLSVAVGLATFAMAQQQKKTRRLGTCGPPPRKNPRAGTTADDGQTRIRYDAGLEHRSR